MTNIRVDTDADGIVTLTWDMPGRSMNVLSEESISEYVAAAEKAIADPAVKGVVVTSGKPAFIAGADLSMLQKQTGDASEAAASPEQRAKAVFDNLMQFNLALRRIEKGGKPFVAAINGLALGGGLEVCLACHHRVVADDPRIQLGLVEVQGRPDAGRRWHAAPAAPDGRHGRAADDAGRPHDRARLPRSRAGSCTRSCPPPT